jgi:acyl-CoA synthetase (NDP forming)
MKVPPLNDRAVTLMDAFLPPFWSRRNPVDLVAPGKVSMITDAIDIVLKHVDLDAILLLGLGYMTLRGRLWTESPVIPRGAIEASARLMIGEEAKLLGLIEEQIKKYGKPIIPVIDQVAFDDPSEHNIVNRLDREGIMAYSAPEQAIRALAKAQEHYRRREKLGGAAKGI